MEEDEVVMPEYMTKYEFEREKNKTYAYINKKHEDMRDRVDGNKEEISKVKDRVEEVHDIHVDNHNKILRKLDSNTYQMGDLSKNVMDLNNSVVGLKDVFEEQTKKVTGLDGRIKTTETLLNEKKTRDKSRKEEFWKFMAILIPALIGTGGLLNWLGPLFFN